MSYLGLQPNTPLLNTSTQTFSGNSVATQFNLARSVASASDLDVMIGSTLQRPFTDYIAGNVVLQFISAPTTGTNNITVTYRGGALNSLDLTASTFNAGTVAAPSVVSLAANNTGIYWANASSMSVTVSGTNRATFLANATSISTDTGALVVDGGAGIDGNVNISGRVAIVDSTESTSVSTGSFKTAGGAGIVGNLNVGGDITCVGDFTVNGTFTTTGTDSLAVTDPFIFLAENNPGDTYDSGVISQYFDGANLRYTGYFRDITDAKYKLFTNLLTEPTTTVDTTDPSFQYTDLILANLSATGNVTGTYFVGNGAALTGISTSSTRIFNANSEVTITAVNANINMVVNGTQIANVWSGGISVVGAVAANTTISATGNVVGGNIQTSGILSATGNITSAANVSAGNLVTGGAVVASGNVTGGNIIGTTNISTTGSVVGGSLRTAGVVSATGDVYGNNFSATTDITAGGLISAVGDITGSNIFTAGAVSAIGNVTGSFLLGNGSQLTGIDAAGIQSGNSNVRVVSSGGNVSIGIGGTSNIAVFSTLGANVTGWIDATGNLNAAGNVAFTGTAQNINIGTSQTTGNVTVGGAAQTGTILIGQSTGSQTVNIGHGVTGSGSTKTIQVGENGAAGSTTLIDIGPATATTAAGLVTFNTATRVAIANTGATALSVAGNVTGANILTGGSTTATGNIVGGNIATAGLITATGNITGGNIITGGAVSITGASTAASYSATGNVTGGNVLTGGLISATGNITGGNLIINGLATVTGNVTSTANVAAGNILTANLIQGATLSATANVFATANVSGAYFLGTGVSLSGNVISGISTAANITGGNVISVAAMSAVSVSASGNINGGNLIVTGVVVDAVGNLELQSTATNGNVNLTPNGTGIVGISTSLSVTGNVTGAGHIGTMYTNSIINTGANLTGNIGSATTYFNTAFVKATSAQYADLAEWYEADDDYSPGTVLVFGGDREVTQAIGINDVRVAGVVSTNPAHVMNSGLKAPHTAALALTGRVPTLVVGAVKKGDMMVTAGGGRAQACAEPRMGSVIGKALQDHPGGQGIIEIVVGRM
jgi:filamentous hemagglutinin